MAGLKRTGRSHEVQQEQTRPSERKGDVHRRGCVGVDSNGAFVPTGRLGRDMAAQAEDRLAAGPAPGSMSSVRDRKAAADLDTLCSPEARWPARCRGRILTGSRVRMRRLAQLCEGALSPAFEWSGLRCQW